MGSRTRAWRRHHRQRVVKQAKRKLRQLYYLGGSGSPGVSEHIERVAPKLADNMKACACAACTIHRPSHRDDVLEFSAREQMTEEFLR